jgi:transposase-like protein
LTQAIRRHGVPETITIDGSEANEAVIKRYNEAHGTHILIRQVKYLNNVGVNRTKVRKVSQDFSIICHINILGA